MAVSNIRAKRRQGISSAVEDSADLFLRRALHGGQATVEEDFRLMKELMSRALEKMKGVAVPKDTILMGGPPEFQIALQTRVRCAKCRALFSERYAESIWLRMTDDGVTAHRSVADPREDDTCPHCGSHCAVFSYDKDENHQT